MSISGCRIPKYRHYKPKSLAVVRLNGEESYLGCLRDQRGPGSRARTADRQQADLSAKGRTTLGHLLRRDPYG